VTSNNSEEGNILMLLGTNGAGKTSTFNIMTGMSEPTSGDVSIYGKSIRTEMKEIRSLMGYVPQVNLLYDQITVKQHLELMCTLRGKKFQLDDYIELLEDLDMVKQLKVRALNLSGGQKRKLALAMAMMGDTKVLFLDEVTSGVDPDSRKKFWSILRKYRESRIIVCTSKLELLLSSKAVELIDYCVGHFLDEAEYLGDKIAIMADGNLRAFDSAMMLKHHHADGMRLSIGSSDPIQLRRMRELVIDKVLVRLPGASFQRTYLSLNFLVPLSSLDQCVEVINEFQQEYLICRLERPSLEGVFLSLTGADSSSNYSNLPQLPSNPRRRIFRALFVKRALTSWREKGLWFSIIVVSLLLFLMPLLFGQIQIASFFQGTVGSVSPDNAVCEADLPLSEFSNDCCRGQYSGGDVSAGFKVCMTTTNQPQCEASSTLSESCEQTFLYCNQVPWMCTAVVCCDLTSVNALIYGCRTDIYIQAYRDYQSNLCPQQNTAYFQGYVNALLNSIWYLLGLVILFVPVIASAVSEKEPTQDTKLMQYLSGVSPNAYWWVSFVWDQTFALIMGFIAVLIATLSGPAQYLGSEVQLAALVEILVFCLTMIPVCYSLSFHFDNHTKALVFIITTSLVLGVGFVIIMSILAQLNFGFGYSSSVAIVTYCDFFLNIFPQYALASGLLYPFQSYYRTFLGDSAYYSNNYGPVPVYSFILNRQPLLDCVFRIAYMILVMIISWIYLFSIESKCCRGCSGRTKWGHHPSTVCDFEDTAKEEQLVEECKDTDYVQFVKLTKGFHGHDNYSVDNLTFGKCISHWCLFLLTLQLIRGSKRGNIWILGCQWSWKINYP